MDTPQAEQLLKKIQELEAAHARLKEEISKFMLRGIIGPGNLISHSISPQSSRLADPMKKVGGGQYGSSRHSSTFKSGSHDPVNRRREVRSPVVNFTNKQYLNILQSVGQSVHIFDSNGRIIYWNRTAEHLYGYVASEVLGQQFNFLIESCDVNGAKEILHKNTLGEKWTGKFPMKNKQGELFVIVAFNTPLYDDIGNLAGVICVTDDAQRYIEAQFTSSGRNPSEAYPSSSQPRSGPKTKSGLDSKQPMQVGIASKISNLASRMTKTVLSNIRTGRKYPGKPLVDYGDESVGKTEIHEIISPGKEAWVSKKGIFWPTEHDCSIVRTTHGVHSWLNHDQENDFLAYDILWEDLKIGETIGQGSCGTVFRGLWCGSDVAVKVFSKLEYSDDLLHSFRKEVSLMKMLRHPNVLLFMGAVTSPQHLCIVTEFLPRGSLFQLLHCKTFRLDWKRRVLMALDIAHGMNYLHRCNPPIVHRDLKSSNLLVDKNLIVKVGDFGLSRIKHHTYLTTRGWKGTVYVVTLPHWMAPEVLRSEPSDEKSDVYSYGVILWELATQKIPWDNLDPMQVTLAVGFMNKRIEIQKDIDPQWVSIIESCWSSEPKCRPTFEELLVKLKDLLRQYSVEAQATWLALKSE